MADPTVIVVQELKGPFAAIAANGANITFAACTVTDGDVFTCTGREILVFKNTTGTNTVTITSVDNDKGRAEDITSYELEAGEVAMFGVGLTNAKGWQSAAKTIRITSSAAELTVAAVRLPAGYP